MNFETAWQTQEEIMSVDALSALSDALSRKELLCPDVSRCGKLSNIYLLLQETARLQPSIMQHKIHSSETEVRSAQLVLYLCRGYACELANHLCGNCDTSKLECNSPANIIVLIVLIRSLELMLLVEVPKESPDYIEGYPTYQSLVNHTLKELMDSCSKETLATIPEHFK